MRSHWTIPATAVLLLILVSGASVASFHNANPPGPTPGTEALGVGENDVRDEPNHGDDDNGFPHQEFSPSTETLILEAFVAPGTGYVRQASVALDNLVNRAQHGSDYQDHEKTMYPGVNRYAAWWGWWTDTGAGGDLQENTQTADLVDTDPNGAIDDVDDCENRSWDEFVHRGFHRCPGKIPHDAHPEDELYAFIQPGTHDLHTNSAFPYFSDGPIHAVLTNESDEPTAPDFEYRSYGQRWEERPRPLDIEYDSSLLITTTVTTAANPKEILTSGEETRYDPHSPGESVTDQEHAVDVDVYTAPSGALEDLYRTAIWDPGDDQESPVDAVHPEGPKAMAKGTVPAAKQEAIETGETTVQAILDPSEPFRGAAQDLASGPFFHEPNQADDEHLGATHDPTTSYGGIQDYYEPGSSQTYDGYQDNEFFWADARISVNELPVPPGIAWGFRTQVSPEAPETGDPVGSALSEDDDNTQGPGFMYVDAFAGTWHDENRDTWVGDAGEDGTPYDHGTTDDPNDYDSPEFRGTCKVDLETTLYPTSDTDGDGTNDWGAAGVYVMDPFGLTYGDPWMDVAGHDADPALDVVRDNVPFGNALFPEQARLEDYHRTGSITLETWVCPGTDPDSGSHHGFYSVVLPTGTLDFTFRAETTAELIDQTRVSQHGDNKGIALKGQTITDIDRYDAIVETGS